MENEIQKLREENKTLKKTNETLNEIIVILNKRINELRDIYERN